MSIATYGVARGYFSVDAEQAVMENIRKGDRTWQDVARNLGVSMRTIWRYRQRVLHEHPELEPRPAPLPPLIQAAQWTPPPPADTTAVPGPLPEPRSVARRPTATEDREHDDMPTTKDILERRAGVAELYFRSYTVRRIATALNVNPSTVQRDIKHILAELQLANLGTLQERLTEAVERLKAVIRAAWADHDQAGPNATNRIGALNVITTAQMEIARLTGLLAPDAVNSNAIAEYNGIIMHVLREWGARHGLRPGQAEQEVAQLLTARMSGTSVGTVLGASDLLPEITDEEDEGSDDPGLNVDWGAEELVGTP
jgi:FixJ family two-component response regulator